MPSEPPKSFRELLTRYNAGERDFSGSMLDEDPDNDLSRVCLDGVDLSNSFLVASLRNASLRHAKFVSSNVKTCDFTGADLRGSDFREAALCSTDFLGADIAEAMFEGAYIHSHVFKRGERPDIGPGHQRT